MHFTAQFRTFSLSNPILPPHPNPFPEEASQYIHTYTRSHTHAHTHTRSHINIQALTHTRAHNFYFEKKVWNERTTKMQWLSLDCGIAYDAREHIITEKIQQINKHIVWALFYTTWRTRFCKLQGYFCIIRSIAVLYCHGFLHKESSTFMEFFHCTKSSLKWTKRFFRLFKCSLR